MLDFNELAVISEHPAAAVTQSRRLSNADLFQKTWPFLGQTALHRP